MLRPDIYAPQVNRADDEMAERFGVLIDPCLAGHLKDKPRVERNAPYARESSGGAATSRASRRCVGAIVSQVRGVNHAVGVAPLA